MKETFYFSHDYHARHDPKLVNLQMEFGMEGVGIYWCLIEMLYEQGGRLRPADYERIAFELRIDTELLKQIVFTDLFEGDKSGDYFWSNTVLERLEKREIKSQKARDSILKRWNKDTNVLRTNNECNTIKESKGKEKKEKEIEYSTTTWKIFETLGFSDKKKLSLISALLEKFPNKDLVAVAIKVSGLQGGGDEGNKWLKFSNWCERENDLKDKQNQFKPQARGITVTN